eukprot:3010183-Prymnesium_polylepis.1
MELRHIPGAPPAHAVAHKVGARHARRVEHSGDMLGTHRARVVRVVRGSVALAVAEVVEAQHAITSTRARCLHEPLCELRLLLLVAKEGVEQHDGRAVALVRVSDALAVRGGEARRRHFEAAQGKTVVSTCAQLSSHLEG